MTQYSRPTSDIVTTGWSSTPLYEKIDEASYSDTDFIQSTGGSGTYTCQVGTSSVTDPNSNANHIIKWRASFGGAGSNTVKTRMYLYQGSTLIATSSQYTESSGFAEHTYTLSSSEADAITDYSALRISIEAVVSGAGGRYGRVSWLEFGVPDAAALVNLAAGSISASGKVLSVLRDVIIQLDTATIAASGKSLQVLWSPVISLDTAGIVSYGQPITVIPGSVTIQLAASLITANGPPVSVLPGDVTIALDGAQISSTGVGLKINQTVNLDAALVSATGQSAAVDAPAPGTVVSLDLVQIAATGQAVLIIPGAVTKSLLPSSIAVSGKVLSVLPGSVTIQLSAGQVLANGQGLSVLPGQVSISVVSAPIILSGKSIQVNQVVPLDIAAITATGQVVVAIPDISINLSAGQVVSTAQIATISSITTINLDTAQASSSAGVVTIVPGPASVSMDAPPVLVLGQSLSVMPGAVSIQLLTGSVIAAGKSFKVYAAGLAVTAEAALAGTDFGLQVTLWGSDSYYGESDISPISITGKARARFYIDPNSISGTQTFDVLTLVNSIGQEFAQVALVCTNGSYSIQLSAINDVSGKSSTSSISISDAEHYIEIYVQRAETSSSSDGLADLYIDGIYEDGVTGVDNYDIFDDFANTRFGAINVSQNVYGVYYLDELVVNDTGEEIGPLGKISLDTATITAFAQTISLAGDINIPLDAALVSVSGQVITPSKLINLGSGSVASVAQNISVVSGAVVVQLNAGQVIFAGQVLSVSGATFVYLNGAQIAVSGQQIIPNKSVNFAFGAIISSGKQLSVVPGPITLQLNAAQVVTSGKQAAVVAGEVLFHMENAVLAASAQLLSVVPGAATVQLGYAQVSVVGRGLTVSAVPLGTSVALNSAQISTNASQITVLCDRIVQIWTASAAVTGRNLSLFTEVTLPLQVAQSIISGQPLSVVPGTATVQLQSAQGEIFGQPISVVPGSIIVGLNIAQLSVSGQSTSVPPNVYLDVATVLAAGERIYTEGTVSVVAKAAVISASGGKTSVVPGAVSLVLAFSQVVSGGKVLVVLPGEAITGLNPAELAITGLLIIPREHFTVLLGTAGLVADGQSVVVVLGPKAFFADIFMVNLISDDVQFATFCADGMDVYFVNEVKWEEPSDD